MRFFLVFLGLFFGLNLLSDNLIVFVAISVVAFLLIFRRFERKSLLLYCIAFIIGISLSFLNLKLNDIKGDYVGIVIESKTNYYIVVSKFERLIVYENNNSKEVGDILRINGNISTLVDTSLESEFSFVLFLKNKGITRQINVANYEYIFKNFIQLKSYKIYFLNLFNNDAKVYVDAFLFNVKNYEDEVMNTIDSLNITHLFSASGFYVSILFRFVEYILFIKFDKRKSKIYTLLILSWYLIFTFNKTSIRRIVYVKTFSIINEYKLKKRFSYLETLSLVGIMMLTLNRFLARQQSFYLGFFISFSLYFVSFALKDKKKFKTKLKMSAFIYLFVLPISLFSSHELHIFTPIFTLILLPLTSFFSFCAVISFYTYPIRPFFSFLATINNGAIKGLNVIDIKVPFKEFTPLFLLFYYGLLFLIIYHLESFSYKNVMKASIAFSFLFIIKITPYEKIYINSITFLNVGQGDSALIRYFDKTILIDTGGLAYKDIATDVTIPFLNSKGINKIDYVFISHQDYDHCGALDSLKRNFRVNEIIDTSSPFIVNINNLHIENINKWAHLFKETNDKSQVLTFSISNKNYLMMGDASKNIENYLIKETFPPIDVIKIGHHGSNTSSSYDFLKHISPKEAVISVGKNNKFGHPNKEVLDNLNKLHITYHRTDLEGSITF